MKKISDRISKKLSNLITEWSKKDTDLYTPAFMQYLTERKLDWVIEELDKLQEEVNKNKEEIIKEHKQEELKQRAKGLGYKI